MFNIESLISYGISVCIATLKFNLKQIIKFQKSIIRVILHLNYVDSEQTHLKYLGISSQVSMVYTLLMQLCILSKTKILNNQSQLVSHAYNFRYKTEIQSTQHRLKYFDIF